MADQAVSVKVSGVAEFQRALKAVDAELPKELKVAFFGVVQHVAGIAQQRMPWKTGRAIGSVRARAVARGGAIAAYGTAAPYGQWLDFGGSVGRGHVSGMAWSGAIKRDWLGVPTGEGRYIYPAISSQREETGKSALDAIQHVAEHQGFEVRG